MRLLTSLGLGLGLLKYPYEVYVVLFCTILWYSALVDWCG